MENKLRIIKKVIAYITDNNRLLVFAHPESPEAGIQVPAGTVKDGEVVEAAVMREAREETGLSYLKREAFLGEYQLDMTPYGKSEIHHRYFYHLTCTETPANEWRHGEYDPTETKVDYIPFDFYWVDLDSDIPELAGEQDKLIDKLREILSA